MNDDSPDMVNLTADFLKQQADSLMEKLASAKTEKQKIIITNQLIELRNRIIYEIKNIDKIIEEND